MPRVSLPLLAEISSRQVSYAIHYVTADETAEAYVSDNDNDLLNIQSKCIIHKQLSLFFGTPDLFIETKYNFDNLQVVHHVPCCNAEKRRIEQQGGATKEPT